jgi:hypothetical protein
MTNNEKEKDETMIVPAPQEPNKPPSFPENGNPSPPENWDHIKSSVPGDLEKRDE